MQLTLRHLTQPILLFETDISSKQHAQVIAAGAFFSTRRAAVGGGAYFLPGFFNSQSRLVAALAACISDFAFLAKASFMPSSERAYASADAFFVALSSAAVSFF